VGSNTHSWQAREREPIMGSGAGPPAGVQGAEPPVGVKGRSPLKPTRFFMFKTVFFNASATVLHEMMYCLSCFLCTVGE